MLAGERWDIKLVCFTTTTEFRSTAKSRAGSPTIRPGVSRRTAGTSFPASTATTSRGRRRDTLRTNAPIGRVSSGCKTVIGKGAPNRAGTDLAHGQALGEKEVELTREALGWRHAPFDIPPAAYEGWSARECGALLEGDWSARFVAYKAAYPELAAEFDRRIAGKLPRDFAQRAASLVSLQSAKNENVATRKASQQRSRRQRRGSDLSALGGFDRLGFH
jgi:hypothetical protein